MVAWSGTRKALTILLFIAPTLIGILVVNIYPMVLSTYISFTNRNRFRPNPDCTVALTGVLDPLCWPAFRETAPVGLGQPYRLQDPLFKNYTDLVGKLFTPEALVALAQIGLCFAPLAGVYVLNRRWEKQLAPPVAPNLMWLGALVLGLALAFALNVANAYESLMQTGDFLVVVFRTLVFVVIRVPFSFVLGLLLALLLNRSNLPGRAFFRVMLFVPWAASSLAILMAKVWEFFFREQGTINQVLRLFNIQGPVWLSNDVTAFGAVVLTDIWFSYPFFMITILGALQAIPTEIYEAAEVDGATWWQQLTRLTLPLIRPAVLPAVVLTSISAFQMFGTAWAITGGGPSRGAGEPGATEFVLVYAYKQIFQTQNYGNATAFAVILFIFLFAATLYSLRLTRITKGALE